MSAQRKIFRIESLQRGSSDSNVTTLSTAPNDDLAAVRHDEIMAAIRNIGSIGQGPVAVDNEPASAILDAVKKDLIEAVKLKQELEDISGVITDTKKEIATLHTTGFKGEEMSRVTDELDAVVMGTEQATESILTAAEDIDQNASTLHAKLKDPTDQGLAEDIQNQVVKIFEACNFQDITGQRITKVVSALRFIEERVLRMMEIMGGIESFAGIEPEKIERAEGDAALLNGPALDDDAGVADQDDIDALFD